MSANKFIVWSQDNCPFCVAAKNLLKSRDFDVEERKIGEGEKYTKEDLLKAVPLARSVPQVFVDGVHIGGYKELRELLT